MPYLDKVLTYMKHSSVLEIGFDPSTFEQATGGWNQMRYKDTLNVLLKEDFLEKMDTGTVSDYYCMTQRARDFDGFVNEKERKKEAHLSRLAERNPAIYPPIKKIKEGISHVRISEGVIIFIYSVILVWIFTFAKDYFIKIKHFIKYLDILSG